MIRGAQRWPRAALLALVAVALALAGDWVGAQHWRQIAPEQADLVDTLLAAATLACVSGDGAALAAGGSGSGSRR